MLTSWALRGVADQPDLDHMGAGGNASNLEGAVGVAQSADGAGRDEHLCAAHPLVGGTIPNRAFEGPLGVARDRKCRK